MENVNLREDIVRFIVSTVPKSSTALKIVLAEFFAIFFDIVGRKPTLYEINLFLELLICVRKTKHREIECIYSSKLPDVEAGLFIKHVAFFELNSPPLLVDFCKLFLDVVGRKVRRHEVNLLTEFLMYPYHIPNGLTGLKRDAAIHLCRVMRDRGENIRRMMGMCQQHFSWTKHFSFAESRVGYREITGVFRRNKGFPCGVCTPTLRGLDYAFPDYAKCNNIFQTVFLRMRLVKGTYRWSVQIPSDPEPDSSFYLGVASPQNFETFDQKCLGIYGNETCSFGFKCVGRDSYTLSLENVRCPSCGVYNFRFYYNMHGCNVKVRDSLKIVPRKTVVSIELDIASRVLFLYLDDRKQPYAFCKVPTPVYFGFSENNIRTFTSVSFRHIPSHTAAGAGPSMSASAPALPAVVRRPLSRPPARTHSAARCHFFEPNYY